MHLDDRSQVYFRIAKILYDDLKIKEESKKNNFRSIDKQKKAPNAISF
jgi:hypothetical protein